MTERHRRPAGESPYILCDEDGVRAGRSLASAARQLEDARSKRRDCGILGTRPNGTPRTLTLSEAFAINAENQLPATSSAIAARVLDHSRRQRRRARELRGIGNEALARVYVADAAALLRDRRNQRAAARCMAEHERRRKEEASA